MTKLSFETPIKNDLNISGIYGQHLVIRFYDAASRAQITKELNEMIKYLNKNLYYPENDNKLTVNCFCESHDWMYDKTYDIFIQSPPIEKSHTLEQLLWKFCIQVSDSLIESVYYDDDWYKKFHSLQYEYYI